MWATIFGRPAIYWPDNPGHFENAYRVSLRNMYAKSHVARRSARRLDALLVEAQIVVDDPDDRRVVDLRHPDGVGRNRRPITIHVLTVLK